MTSTMISPISRCRDCNAPIIWALTESERRMPVDAETSDNGNLVLFRVESKTYVKVVAPGPGNHRPHFATCPNAAEWRR